MLFDRRILVQVTLPFVLVSLVFLAACTIGVWSINRLQLNRSALLTRNVRSLRAAQEMEVPALAAPAQLAVRDGPHPGPARRGGR